MVGVCQRHKLQHPHRVKVSPWEHSQEVCTWIISGWEQVADHVIASSINKAEILVAENTSKADNKSSDSDDDVMLGSAFGNFQSDKAILSLFLSDMEKSDFAGFSAKED